MVWYEIIPALLFRYYAIPFFFSLVTCYYITRLGFPSLHASFLAYVSNFVLFWLAGLGTLLYGILNIPIWSGAVVESFTTTTIALGFLYLYQRHWPRRSKDEKEDGENGDLLMYKLRFREE